MSIKLTLDSAYWQKEVSDAIKVLDRFSRGLETERKKMLEYAVIPLVSELQRRAPVGAKIHVRYTGIRGERKPKGKGNRKAYYYPGNLKGSFSVLDLRKSTAVIIGARLAKGSTRQRGGMFGKSKYDAYYLAMVEFGTVYSPARPFVRSSFISAAPHCVRRINNAARLYAEKFTRQHAVK